MKLALHNAAQEAHVIDRLNARASTYPIVWAERRRRVIDVTYIDGTRRHRDTARVAVVVRAGKAIERTVELLGAAIVGGYSSSDMEVTNAYLTLDPPLPPGRYDLELLVDLVDTSKVITSRHIALRPLIVGASVASVDQPEASQSPNVAPSAPPPVPPPPGCACEAPGGARGSGAAAALVVAGALGRRRRRDASPQSRWRRQPSSAPPCDG